MGPRIVDVEQLEKEIQLNKSSDVSYIPTKMMSIKKKKNSAKKKIPKKPQGKGNFFDVIEHATQPIPSQKQRTIKYTLRLKI